MKPFRSLLAITRRELGISYISPLICQLLASSSGSGSGIAATLDILPVNRLAGPASLSLEKLDGTTVRLTWSTQVYIYSYVIYRATNSEGPFMQVTANVISDTFTDIDLPPGTYFYKVTGVEPSAGETFSSPVAGPVTTP